MHVKDTLNLTSFLHSLSSSPFLYLINLLNTTSYNDANLFLKDGSWSMSRWTSSAQANSNIFGSILTLIGLSKIGHRCSSSGTNETKKEISVSIVSYFFSERALVFRFERVWILACSFDNTKLECAHCYSRCCSWLKYFSHLIGSKRLC